MTFLPAPPNSGIRFRRVDLEGKPEIEARIENVIETNRSTTLGKGNVKVHTVEHLLSTFAGMGVDNVLVELDAGEPPIADGSARDYCKMVQTAGIEPQAERREPLLAQLNIRVRDVQQSPDGLLYVATELVSGGNDPDGTILRIEPVE